MDAMNTEDVDHAACNEPARKRRKREDDVMMENGHQISEKKQPSPALTLLGNHQRFTKEDLLRLIIQQIYLFGYDEVAGKLEHDSNTKVEHPDIKSLRQAVEVGNWSAAVGIVKELDLEEKSKNEAVFIILKAKFLEGLERRDKLKALQCLREELSPIPGYLENVKQLSALLLCSTPQELYSKADCRRSETPGRQWLIQELQGVLPASLMVPERRLEQLVDQAIAWQLAQCAGFNSDKVQVSLLSDFTCGKERVPSITTQILEGHEDEVWHVQFSHKGHMLASASKDGVLIFWEVLDRTVAFSHKVNGHDKEIPFVVWSPDDSCLASCSADCTVKLWDPVHGTCKAILSHHTKGVQAAAWLPNGESLVTGGRDKRIFLVERTGKVIKNWETQTIHDLAVSHDGRYILMNSSTASYRAQPGGPSAFWLKVFNLDTCEELKPKVAQAGMDVSNGTGITSMAMSRNRQHVLLSMTNQELQEWPLKSILSAAHGELPEDESQCQVYSGMDPRISRLVMRACYGGTDDRFVCSGSNEGKVYIWHRGTGNLLRNLEGHAGPVNSVSWSPADSCMLASCSDDKSIHIWGLAKDMTDESP